jgi:hypothetical protein
VRAHCNDQTSSQTPMRALFFLLLTRRNRAEKRAYFALFSSTPTIPHPPSECLRGWRFDDVETAQYAPGEASCSVSALIWKGGEICPWLDCALPLPLLLKGIPMKF